MADLIEKAMALGGRSYFFREGKAVQAGGVCSGLVMPDPNDPGWADLSTISAWEPKMKTDESKEVWGSPTGGNLVLMDDIPTKQAIQYTFTSNVLTAQAIGLFFRTAEEVTTATKNITPLSGVSPRGWLMMLNRNQDEVLIFAANLWGRLKCTGGLKGGDGSLIEPTFEFPVFYSPANIIGIAPGN
jgi:hypothetical protein